MNHFCILLSSQVCPWVFYSLILNQLSVVLSSYEMLLHRNWNSWWSRLIHSSNSVYVLLAKEFLSLQSLVGDLGIHYRYNINVDLVWEVESSIYLILFSSLFLQAMGVFLYLQLIKSVFQDPSVTTSLTNFLVLVKICVF